MKINTSRQSGFTLVEIMIVVAIIGLLAAIAIPNFVKARTASQKNACIANLKQLEGAKATWALENNKLNTSQAVEADLIGANAYIRSKPTCPSGGADYLAAAQIGVVSSPATCSLAGTLGHSLP